MIEQLLTIGVYGFTQDSFFATLHSADVDTLIDIRWRRGVRGAEYAFANSQRLQTVLAEMGIGYIHCRELAPPPTLREKQKSADVVSQLTKRHRISLSADFSSAYEQTILDTFDPNNLQNQLPITSKRAVLLCVERDPLACHRSLVAHTLMQIWNIPVNHLMP